MNKDTTDAMVAWGDRQSREAAHLMDLCVAGAIDQLVGHGTVILKPARIEEIVSRIAPRERDEDGNWKVTLLPDEGASNHGTALQAVEWAIEHCDDSDPMVFMRQWFEGNAREEWPEYYEWLGRQS